MDGFLKITLVNALSATILAGGVLVASRFIRRPSIVYALWVVVLLKLVTPPVLEIGLFPAGDGPRPDLFSGAVIASTAETGGSTDTLGATEGTSALAIAAEPANDRALLKRLALCTWLTGSVVLLLLAAARGFRFQRFLRGASAVSTSLSVCTATVASHMGVAACPAVRVVPARISPMLWFPLRRLQLLFPRDLLGRLGRLEREALVAHELAHVLRRDYWVRYLELIVGALFWWHPVVWWARRRMRAAEESCCDDHVLRALPGHARAYADGLLKTVEFLSGSHERVPSVTCSAADTRNLKERFTMILKNRVPKKLSRPRWLLLSLLAVTPLLVFPTRAERASGHEPSTGAADASPTIAGGGESGAAARDDRTEIRREHLREIDQRMAELELEMRRLQARRIEVEHDLEAQARELDAEGRYLEALQQAELMQRQDRLRSELEQIEQNRHERSAVLEAQLRESQMRADELAAEGQLDLAEEMRQRARALEFELQGHNEEADRLRLRLENERIGHERDDRERTIRMLKYELERLQREHANRERGQAY